MDLITLEPTTHQALAVIDNAAKLAESTKVKYRRALEGYLETGNTLTDRDALEAYSQGLSNSVRAHLKAAIRLWTEKAKDAFKSKATPDNVNGVQAALYRLDALQNAIEVEKPKGQKTHTWLSSKEVRELLNTCNGDFAAERDRLLLGLLVAAGLRREEAAKLQFKDVVLQPVRGRIRTVLAIEGKGAKKRTVPISDSLANAIDAWAVKVGGGGQVLRSLGMARKIGESISAVAIFHVVRKRGVMIGKPELAPHDLRRSYAQIGLDAGIPITQISGLLGHESVATTQRYLNLDVDLETTVSDFVPF